MQQEHEREPDEIPESPLHERASEKEEHEREPLDGHELEAPELKEDVRAERPGHAGDEPRPPVSGHVADQEPHRVAGCGDRQQEHHVVGPQRIVGHRRQRPPRERHPEEVLVEDDGARDRGEERVVPQPPTRLARHALHAVGEDHGVGVAVPPVGRAGEAVAESLGQRPGHADGRDCVAEEHPDVSCDEAGHVAPAAGVSSPGRRRAPRPRRHSPLAASCRPSDGRRRT